MSLTIIPSIYISDNEYEIRLIRNYNYNILFESSVFPYELVISNNINEISIKNDKMKISKKFGMYYFTICIDHEFIRNDLNMVLTYNGGMIFASIKVVIDDKMLSNLIVSNSKKYSCSIIETRYPGPVLIASNVYEIGITFEKIVNKYDRNRNRNNYYPNLMCNAKNNLSMIIGVSNDKPGFRNDRTKIEVLRDEIDVVSDSEVSHSFDIVITLTINNKLGKWNISNDEMIIANDLFMYEISKITNNVNTGIMETTPKCILENSYVTMYDGNEILIQNVKIGDKLWNGMDMNDRINYFTVNKIFMQELVCDSNIDLVLLKKDMFFIDRPNRDLYITKTHLLMIRDEIDEYNISSLVPIKIKDNRKVVVNTKDLLINGLDKLILYDFELIDRYGRIVNDGYVVNNMKVKSRFVQPSN